MEVLESLIGAVRRCCAAFPDQRTGTNVRYAMPDIGMGAFSLFFVQSPSFLDFQRRLEAGHGRSNCQTLFGMSRIPTDNHIRAMLDPRIAHSSGSTPHCAAERALTDPPRLASLAAGRFGIAERL